MLRGLSAGIFGEAYVVAIGTNVGSGTYRAENFILTQRPTGAIAISAIDIASATFPAELGAVDKNFAIEEGLGNTEFKLQQMLEARARLRWGFRLKSLP